MNTYDMKRRQSTPGVCTGAPTKWQAGALHPTFRSKLTTLVRLGAWSAGSRAASAASSRRAMMTCSTICAAFRFTLQHMRTSACGCNATSATEDREALSSKVQRLCNQIGRIGMLT